MLSVNYVVNCSSPLNLAHYTRLRVINESPEDPNPRHHRWEAGVWEGVKAEDGSAHLVCFHHHHCLRLHSYSSCQRLSGCHGNCGALLQTQSRASEVRYQTLELNTCTGNWGGRREQELPVC